MREPRRGWLPAGSRGPRLAGAHGRRPAGSLARHRVAGSLARHRLARLAIALTAAAALAGGCATFPASGTPVSAPARPAFGAGSDGCCALIVRGPQPDWNAGQVVQGFLLASASPAHDFALARQYLAPGRPRNSWQPGSQVTILTSSPTISTQRLSQSGGKLVVVVSGTETATLTGDQYTPAVSGDQPAPPQDFTLTSVNGRTYIDLVSNGLLLTDNLFHLVYTGRNLYYYGLRNGALVPSPVFVRADSNLADTLVNDLRQNPPGEQRNALYTGFPPGTRVGPVQTAPGRTAIVGIDLPEGTGSSTYLTVARQLVATLTNSDYGPPLFNAVKLKINGVMWKPAPRASSVLTPGTPGFGMPGEDGNGPVYYLTPQGGGRMLDSRSARGLQLPGDAGSARPPLRDVSVSPDRKLLAGIDATADTVYTASLGHGSAGGGSAAGGHSSPGQLSPRLFGTGFTSLSWDNSGYLWVAGRVNHQAGLWVLPPGRGGPIRVIPPSGLGHVSGVRVAPDGTQVAMIVGRGTAAHIELADIEGNGRSFALAHVVPLGSTLSAVSAISWFDDSHLVVAAQVSKAAQTGSAPPQLWEVPANGDVALSLHWQQAGITSIAADGQQNPLYLSASGRLEKSVALGEPWTDVTAGQAANYPG